MLNVVWIQLNLSLLLRLMLSDSNDGVTEKYISGKCVLGALAGEYLKAKGLKDPKARMTFLTQMGITKTWKSKIDIVVEYLYSFIENINFKHHYNYDR